MERKRLRDTEKRTEYLMPFGKHKGKPLSKIETTYLDWLIGKDLRDPLKTAVEQELESRPEWKDGSFVEDADDAFEDEGPRFGDEHD